MKQLAPLRSYLQMRRRWRKRRSNHFATPRNTSSQHETQQMREINRNSKVIIQNTNLYQTYTNSRQIITNIITNLYVICAYDSDSDSDSNNNSNTNTFFKFFYK
jgi:hypothetical protein